MTLRFVPPKRFSRYALFVDYGTGSGFFKTYDQVGFAKAALPHHNHGLRNAAKILEMVDGEWYVLYDIPAGITYQELPWVKEVRQGWRARYSTIKKAVPMTRDEYAEWRVRVEREKLGINA